VRVAVGCHWEAILLNRSRSFVMALAATLSLTAFAVAQVNRGAVAGTSNLQLLSKKVGGAKKGSGVKATRQGPLASIIPTRMDEVMPGQILVKIPPSQAAQYKQQRDGGVKVRMPIRLAGDVQMTYASTIAKSGWTLWTVPNVVDTVELAKRMKSQPGVLNAQPVNRVYPLLSTPNDPDFNVEERDETYILNFGEEDIWFRRDWHIGETRGFEGWSVWPNTWYTAASKPRNAPLVAVIDTGTDIMHPDFRNAGSTSTDSANGGQIDFSLSKQFTLGEVNDFGSPMDAHGHGSHVAGLALAGGNNGSYNGKGLVGAGYGCRGMILRVFDDTGSGTDSDAAAALYYAADNGAKVINLSLGTRNYSQLFQDACTYAWQKGCLIVAAGNEDGGGGGDLGPIYPAACSGVLGVTANGPDQIPAVGTYTGYGRYIDIAAPGGDLIQGLDYIVIQFVYGPSATYDVSTTFNGALYPPYLPDYTYLAGTSMASPIVAGAAGHYFGYKNYELGDFTNLKVYRALERSADGVMGAPYGGWELYQGYGSLNMENLMLDLPGREELVGAIEGIVYLVETPMSNVPVQCRKVGSTGAWTSTTTAADGTYRFEALTPGTYDVRVSIFGNVKQKRTKVIVGSDFTGHDFRVPNGQVNFFDESAPTIGRFQLLATSANSLSVAHWGYDTESGVDKFQVDILNSSNTVLSTHEIYPDDSNSSITGLNLAPGNYSAVYRVTNGSGLTTSISRAFTVTGQTFINGTVALPGYNGSARQLTVSIRNPGSTTALETYNVNVANNGTFTINTARTGTFDVSIKGAHFLRQTLTNRTLSGSVNMNFSLFNGDVNGDNMVTNTDLLQIRQAWGTFSGGSGFNTNADLNGDGVIGNSDFLIFRQNYGRNGDN